MELTQKLLGYLNRVFDKRPGKVLALRLRYDGQMTWRVRDAVLTTEVVGGSGEALRIDLTAYTIAELVQHLASQPGYSVVYTNTSVGSRGARALMDAAGDQDNGKNGDHLYIYTSILWAYMEAIARELSEARTQIGEAVKQITVETAEGHWLDVLGDQYNVPRHAGESDERYAPRIIAEVLYNRSNNYAIADAISRVTGAKNVRVIDAPPQEVPIPGGGTAMSYGLFDVLYDFELDGGDDIDAFARWVRRTIDDFRAAGTHLRQMAFSGSLSEVDTEEWNDDALLFSGRTAYQDEMPNYARYFHDGTYLRDGSIRYQPTQDTIELEFNVGFGTDADSTTTTETL